MLDRLKKKNTKYFTNKELKSENEEIKIILGKLLSELNLKKTTKVNEIEFKMFSQFGDDGIIQFLINKIDFDEDRKFCGIWSRKL